VPLSPSPTVPAPPRASGTPERRAVAAVWWEDGAILIIDQRRLPDSLVEWRLETVADVKAAIESLAVRGAPAIGITGAYGLVVGLDENRPRGRSEAITLIRRLEREIGVVRPTAVNLAAALRRTAAAAERTSGDVAAIRANALAEALRIHAEDQAACDAIGRHGLELLGTRRRILTHCNTGRLATGGNGTALGVVYALQAAGLEPQVLATEARPVLQGARLTAWELLRSGVATRLIADSAAGFALSRGMADAVIVGCDRVAANGDTANKIGTYSLAVLARRHGVPFYVAGPLSSFDPATPGGEAIVIEERNGDEVRGFHGRRSAPAEVEVWNPAFDVTPADLIDAFITEVGIIRPPFGPAIAAAFGGARIERPLTHAAADPTLDEAGDE
jgi:methylthioribose-1-phosphate isomerase